MTVPSLPTNPIIKYIIDGLHSEESTKQQLKNQQLKIQCIFLGIVVANYCCSPLNSLQDRVSLAEVCTIALLMIALIVKRYSLPIESIEILLPDHKNFLMNFIAESLCKFTCSKSIPTNLVQQLANAWMNKPIQNLRTRVLFVAALSLKLQICPNDPLPNYSFARLFEPMYNTILNFSTTPPGMSVPIEMQNDITKSIKRKSPLPIVMNSSSDALFSACFSINAHLTVHSKKDIELNETSLREQLKINKRAHHILILKKKGCDQEHPIYFFNQRGNFQSYFTYRSNGNYISGIDEFVNIVTRLYPKFNIVRLERLELIA